MYALPDAQRIRPTPVLRDVDAADRRAASKLTLLDRLPKVLDSNAAPPHVGPLLLYHFGNPLAVYIDTTLGREKTSSSCL
jgi:hypothetical protein